MGGCEGSVVGTLSVWRNEPADKLGKSAYLYTIGPLLPIQTIYFSLKAFMQLDM